MIWNGHCLLKKLAGSCSDHRGHIEFVRMDGLITELKHELSVHAYRAGSETQMQL